MGNFKVGKFKIKVGKGYDWPTYIYIMQGRNGNKFGITNNIERRTKRYSKTNPELALSFYKLLDDRNEARWMEYNMKLHFTIISGSETTSAEVEEIKDYINNFNISLPSPK